MHCLVLPATYVYMCMCNNRDNSVIWVIWSSESDDECTGRVIVVACVVTFIVSVTATAIITFILTRIYVKRKFENIYDFQGHQSSDVQEKLLYEEMSSSSDTFTENGVKLQPHPAYQVMK